MNYYTNRETDICEDNRYGKPERWHLIVFAILAVILAGVWIFVSLLVVAIPICHNIPTPLSSTNLASRP